MSNLYNLDDIQSELNQIRDELTALHSDTTNNLNAVMEALNSIESSIPSHKNLRLAVSEGIIIGAIFLFILFNCYNYLTK